MSDRSTFISDCLTGHAQLDEIEQYIEAWHVSDTKLDLAAYLGMDDDEYAAWLEDPRLLRHIVNARYNGRRMNIADYAKSSSLQGGLAARSADPKEAQTIHEWLTRTGRIQS